MTGSGTALAWLSMLVAGLIAVLAFALLRFVAAARLAKRQARDGVGDRVLLSAVMQDAFSTLRAREQEMSARAVASEALSAQVFDSLTVGLIVVGPTGEVTIVNPAASRMFDLPADVGGTSYVELLRGSAITSPIREGLSSRGPLVRRVIDTSAAGPARHYSVTVSPLGNAGTLSGAICLVADVTAVVELEGRLQLKEALARVGEMTAGIAHEFRNGLATIHGYSRLIDLETLPAPYQTYVEGIRLETDALSRVVTNFLNFARPEQLSVTVVDLATVARRTVDDLVADVVPPAAVTVSGEFGTIQGDEVLLRQMFDHLVRNAAEACEVAQVAPAVVISGQVEPATQAVRIAVSDNGPGIAVADRSKVFQPFFTTRSRGHGLGLAIVQKVVLLHNGTVSVGASPGGGARIELTFPLIAGESPRPHA